MANLADEIYERINCYGMGSWLERLFDRLTLDLPGGASSPEVRFTARRSAGMLLTVYALGDRPPTVPTGHDGLVLERAELDATVAPPLGLDRNEETPASAMNKLSRDVVGGSPGAFAAGDFRVSYFMPGARVLELTFRATLAGLDRVLLMRLGGPLDWRRPKDMPR